MRRIEFSDGVALFVIVVFVQTLLCLGFRPSNEVVVSSIHLQWLIADCCVSFAISTVDCSIPLLTSVAECCFPIHTCPSIRDYIVGSTNH